jgi:hypothetical protein
MRLIVCGLDASGQSCLVSQTELAYAPIPGVPGAGVAKLYAIDQSPPPSSPPGKGKFSGDSLAPGQVSWYIINHEPRDSNEEHAGNVLHYRNAVDMVVILEGGGDMMLGDGAHPAQAGDCIVMPGIDHGLRSGPQGCRLMSLAIGTPPAS